MKNFIAISLIGFLGLGFPCGAVRAEQSKDQPATRTAKGLQFNVPEDWPIEERGGAVGPVPIEEYLVLKFGKEEKRLSQLEAQSGETNQKLSSMDSKLKKLEEGVANMDTRLSDLEEWLKQGKARRM